MRKVKIKNNSNNQSNGNILVISHTCFSKNDSMGSTLANYLSAYPENKIFEFYIKDMKPNCFKNAHYYRWTDKEVLKFVFGFYSKKHIGTSEIQTVSDAQSSQKEKSMMRAKWNKRSKGLLIRHLLWSIAVKHNKDLARWITNANPQTIVLMPGDFQFVYKMAYKIAKQRNIPIVIMQCESYLLKPYFSKSLFYKIYRKSFAKWYRKTMKYTKSTVYLCSELENDYRKLFPNSRHITIYKPFEPIASKKQFFKRVPNSFIYAGNLGAATGRLDALCTLCSCLSSSKYKIKIYTNTPKSFLTPLSQFDNVTISGLINYEKLVEEYYKTEYIIHIENSKEEHIEDLKYAFSTKISDILSYGCIGLVVGSEKIAGINYLKTNNCAVVVDEPNRHLIELLESMTKSDKEIILNNCLFLLKKNHSKIENSAAFVKEITKC